MANLQRPAPIRQPMFDGRGNLTRPWLLYFIGGGTTAQLVETINETISQSGLLSGFDDFNQRDFSGQIDDLIGQLSAIDSQRDYSEAIEEAKLRSEPATQRDFTPEIEDLNRRLAALESPRAVTVPDATGDSTPANPLGFQQQLDELRVLIASVPTPLPPGTVDAAGALLAANNLDDVGDAATALANLVGSTKTWTPTLTPTGSMTISDVVFFHTGYIVVGTFVLFTLYFQAKFGGTTTAQFNISMPVASTLNSAAPVAALLPGVAWYHMVAFQNGSSSWTIDNLAGAFQTTAAYGFFMAGVYQVS